MALAMLLMMTPMAASVARGYFGGYVWLASWEPLRHLEGVSHHLAFSPDGQRIISASADNTVAVWDAQSGARLMVASGGRNDTWTVDYRSDSRGLWRATGAGAEKLFYRDVDEVPQPAPWIPRRWAAADLPELKAPD